MYNVNIQSTRITHLEIHPFQRSVLPNSVNQLDKSIRRVILPGQRPLAIPKLDWTMTLSISNRSGTHSKTCDWRIYVTCWLAGCISTKYTSKEDVPCKPTFMTRVARSSICLVITHTMPYMRNNLRTLGTCPSTSDDKCQTNHRRGVTIWMKTSQEMLWDALTREQQGQLLRKGKWQGICVRASIAANAALNPSRQLASNHSIGQCQWSLWTVTKATPQVTLCKTMIIHSMSMTLYLMKFTKYARPLLWRIV